MEDDKGDSSLVYDSPSGILSGECSAQDATPRFVDIFKGHESEDGETPPAAHKAQQHPVTFSDRVFHERLKIKMQQLRASNKAASPKLNAASTGDANGHVPAHTGAIEAESLQSGPSDSPESSLSEWYNKSVEKLNIKHKEIQKGLHQQTCHSLPTEEAYVNLKDENKRLKLMLEQLNTKIEQISNQLQVERKHNEIALLEKTQYIDRIQHFTMEIDNLNKNRREIEEEARRQRDKWEQRELELLKKAAQLEGDVHHFMNQVHQAQSQLNKETIQLKLLMENYTAQHALIDKLQQEIRASRELNLHLKAQNQSLIELNETLRTRRRMYKYADALEDNHAFTPSFDVGDKYGVIVHHDHVDKDEVLSFDQVDVGSTKDGTYRTNDCDGELSPSIEPLILPTSSMVSSTTLEPSIYGGNFTTSPTSTLGDATCSTNATTQWMMQRVTRSTSQESLASLKEKLSNLSKKYPPKTQECTLAPVKAP